MTAEGSPVERIPYEKQDQSTSQKVKDKFKFTYGKESHAVRIPKIDLSSYTEVKTKEEDKVWLTHSDESGRLQLRQKERYILQDNDIRLNDLIIDSFFRMLILHYKSYRRLPLVIEEVSFSL